MPTLSEIDEALRHSSLIPVEQRGAVWREWTDRLLEQRQVAELEELVHADS